MGTKMKHIWFEILLGIIVYNLVLIKDDDKEYRK